MSSPTSTNVSINSAQEICISGRIDLSNVERVFDQVINLMTPLTNVRIDLSGVSYADSSSLAMLIECIRNAKKHNKDILFCNMPQFMLDLGRVCSLDTILPIHKPLQFHS